VHVSTVFKKKSVWGFIFFDQPPLESPGDQHGHVELKKHINKMMYD